MLKKIINMLYVHQKENLKTKFIYSSYKKVENEGYVVVHDKKYEYISTTGKKLIKYKKEQHYPLLKI